MYGSYQFWNTFKQYDSKDFYFYRIQRLVEIKAKGIKVPDTD